MHLLLFSLIVISVTANFDVVDVGVSLIEVRKYSTIPSCLVPSCDDDLNVNLFLPESHSTCCDLPLGGVVSMSSDQTLEFSVAELLKTICSNGTQALPAQFSVAPLEERIYVNIVPTGDKVEWCSDQCLADKSTQVNMYKMGELCACNEAPDYSGCHSFSFQGLLPDTSVEGVGAVSPYLNIKSSSNGTLVVVESGRPPANGYAAFNAGAQQIGDNSHQCLEDQNDVRALNGRGFADVEANIPGAFHSPDLEIDILGNLPATDFSLRVFDFGDFEVLQRTEGGFQIEINGYDSFGNLLSQQVKVVSESPQCMIPVCSADACGASDSKLDPGYFTLSLSGVVGLRRVTISQSGQLVDPNVGYDSIKVCF